MDIYIRPEILVALGLALAGLGVWTVRLFVGVGSTREDSRQQVLIYLKNNAEEWGETVA